MKTSKQVSEAAILKAVARAADPREVWGISWGIAALDKSTGGIQPHEMAVLISRPNVGKSALAGRLLRSVSEQFLEDDRVVKLFTFEMSAEAVQMRLACQLADVGMHRIKAGFATPAQLQRYKEAQATLAELPIVYFDQRMTMTEIEREVREHDTGWWVLDHIRLVKDVSQAANPYQKVGELSSRIKGLIDTSASGLIITHQNRSKQNAVDKRPDMESIGNSDAIGQDADIIFGIWRDDVGKFVNEAERDLAKPGELVVIKGRDCPAGYAIEMIFDPVKAMWIEKPQHLTVVAKEAV